MAIVAADWSVDRDTGNIRYIGNDHDGAAPSYATVIEFHRWLQGLADDAEYTGNDEVDIININPSSRSTDNLITLLGTYNIDDTAAEHLYDGSIVQDGGDTIYDGIVNFGNASVQVQIIQDGAVLADDWWNKGAGGAHDGANNASVLTDSGESWTTDQYVGYTIYNTTDGSRGLITANTSTTITATLYGGTDNDWDTADAYLIGVPLNSDAVQGISHRFMIKTRANGVDIDRRRLIGTNRRYGNTYGEFNINGTARGNNGLALADSSDLNNSTAYATINALADISNTEGLRLIDINGDSTTEEYYAEWDRGANTINTFYEYTKKLSADGTTDTLNGLNGELFRGVTHSFAYDGETGTMFTTNDEGAYGELLAYDTGSGTFTVGEAIHGPGATPAWKGRVLGGQLNAATPGTLIVDLESGTLTDSDAFTGQSSGASAAVNDATPPTTPTTTAGVMRFYAVDDDGTTGNLYGQLLKGVPPVNNTRIYDDANVSNFVDVNGSVTARAVSTPFSGVSTGSALIGAYGFGIESADTSASDIFTDLGGNTINPPNNVTFEVAGLVSTEDYVFVGPWDGSTLDADGNPDVDFNQLTHSTLINGATVGSIVVDTAIPSDTPSAGTIRVQTNTGFYQLCAYTGFSGSTFTISPTEDFSSDNSDGTGTAKNVFISYLDKLSTGATESFTFVYSADRQFVIKVRDGGASPIKEYITSGTMGSNGGSTTAIRTVDA